MASILLGTGGYGYGYQPAQSTDQLYYEVLEMSLSDLEQRKIVKIIWPSEGIMKDELFELLIHKQAQFTEVLAMLQKRAGLPEEILQDPQSHIRFYEAHQHKIYKVLPLSHSVAAMNEYMAVYAERIPEEEREFDKARGDRLINCFHFDKEPSKFWGVPFIFMLKGDEPFKETKERISKRTGLKGKQFEKVRFAIIKNGANYGRPVWLDDDELILSQHLGPDDHLGLEHPNRTKYNYLRYESLNIR